MKTIKVRLTADTFPVIPAPPKEYLYYYHARTDAHVKRVQKNMGLLSTFYPNQEKALKDRAVEHD